MRRRTKELSFRIGTKDSWSLLKSAARDFSEDMAASLAAALAFFSALSFAPILVLLLSVAAFFGESERQAVILQVQSFLGEAAGQGVNLVMENAKDRNIATAAGILSIAALAFSATGVFAQLQTSLNRVWDVRPKPTEGLWGWIRRRILTFGMVLAVCFLLLMSLAVSTVLGVLLPQEAGMWKTVNFVVSLLVVTLFFALIFRYLPDVEIAMRNVWIGASLSGVLFTCGKSAIAIYLAHTSVAGAYGAAGSLVLLLLWMYYSAMIFLFGAELTQVLARQSGDTIRPSRHAEWEPEAREVKPATKRTPSLRRRRVVSSHDQGARAIRR